MWVVRERDINANFKIFGFGGLFFEMGKTRGGEVETSLLALSSLRYFIAKRRGKKMGTNTPSWVTMN